MREDLRRLHRRCRERMRDLDIPEPFTIEGFCGTLARQRGRPLRLHQLPDGSAEDMPCGAWLADATADHIVYEPGTSPLHRDHIILHELAHMLCGHALGRDEDMARYLLPDLDPGLTQRMLARASYTTDQEREAEILAGMILRAAARQDASPLGRLGDALGGS